MHAYLSSSSSSSQWQCLLINYDDEDLEDLEDNLNAEFHVADLTDMPVKTIDEFVQLSANHEIVVIVCCVIINDV